MGAQARRSSGPGPADARRSAIPVVEAKLAVPVSRPGIVERRGLVELVRRSTDASVVSLVAPAGYGKTTLLTQWIERDGRPTVWLSLDEHDDDPSVLLAHLAVAFDRIAPLDPAVFRAVASPGPLGAAPSLGSAIRALERPFLLVIDDLHRVRGRESLDAIAVLIEDVPSGSQIALAGRSLEGLPVARLRAERRLLEIDAATLALDGDEAVLLFRAVGIDLPDEDVRSITGRAEGWAAALYLTAISIRSGRLSSDVAVPTGDDAYIADYIRSELLTGLSAKDQRFMTRTSVLERMSGPLCDAVIGGRGSATTLERLERSSLLLIPEDHRREWYRYHPLLRDLLALELGRREPGRAPELLRRAAEWHRGNGMPETAIEYGIAAEDDEQVVELIASLTLPMYRAGRAATLERWFDWCDARGLLEAHPSMAVLRAWLLTLSGDAAAANRWLDVAERGAPTARPAGDITQALVSLLTAVRCTDGIAAMRSDAERGLEAITPDISWYATALLVRGTAMRLGGDAEAEHVLTDAAELGADLGAAPSASLALAELAIDAVSRGAWGEAEALVERASSVIREANITWYPTSFLVYAVGARLAAHRGDGERARADVARTQRLRPTIGRAMPWLAVESRIQLIHAHIQSLDASGARILLREIREIQRHVGDLGRLDEQVEDLDGFIAKAPGLAMGASALSTAELRVLPYLQTHLSFREIGERLFISHNTVKTHSISIYRKLGASSRSDAVTRARELDLIEG
jgi:LuxR family transcriptional regulator, maltose regulon positive regulatory protein